MVLNHINYKMPIYKDCTLGEMLAVGASTLLVLSLSLGVLTKLLFNYAAIGIALSIFSLVHVTRFLLGQLEKLKYGKPYGYYQHLVLKKAQHVMGLKSVMSSPFLQRQGRWSVRRR